MQTVAATLLAAIPVFGPELALTFWWLRRRRRHRRLRARVKAYTF